MGAMKSFSHPQIPIIHSADLLQHTISFYIEAIDYALLNSQEFLMTTFFTLPKILIIIIYHITVVKLLRKQRNELCQTFLYSYVLCTSVHTYK